MPPHHHTAMRDAHAKVGRSTATFQKVDSVIVTIGLRRVTVASGKMMENWIAVG